MFPNLEIIPIFKKSMKVNYKAITSKLKLQQALKVKNMLIYVEENVTMENRFLKKIISATQ